MKVKHILYILLLCLGSTASQCQNSGSISKIEFTTLTRGYLKQIFISPDSVIQIIDGRQEDNRIVRNKLESGRWSAFTKTLDKIDLKEIPQLESPSSRRAFDGARHSTITITTHDGQTLSHSFDDESPHEKLQDLMHLIKQVQDNKSDQK